MKKNTATENSVEKINENEDDDSQESEDDYVATESDTKRRKI